MVGTNILGEYSLKKVHTSYPSFPSLELGKRKISALKVFTTSKDLLPAIKVAWQSYFLKDVNLYLAFMISSNG